MNNTDTGWVFFLFPNDDEKYFEPGTNVRFRWTAKKKNAGDTRGWFFFFLVTRARVRQDDGDPNR